jgi:hypothetical protein
LSTTLLEDENPGTDAGTKVSIVRSGVEVRGSAAAEENDSVCRNAVGDSKGDDPLVAREGEAESEASVKAKLYRLV